MLTKLYLEIKRILAAIVGKIIVPSNRLRRSIFREKLVRPLKRITCELPDIDIFTIPIFIISFNQLSYIQKMVNSLEKYGCKNIHIIDNASDYPPLVEYLKNSLHHIHLMNKNWGHRVFWESGEFDDIVNSHYYILTDPDIEFPDNLPENFIVTMLQLLCEYPAVQKVGLALRIDDLPENPNSVRIINWEGEFWRYKINNPYGLQMYDALLDTTFALYRPGKPFGYFSNLRAIRLAGRFTVRHLPWYSNLYGDEQNRSEEENYYFKHANDSSTLANYMLQSHETKK